MYEKLLKLHFSVFPFVNKKWNVWIYFKLVYAYLHDAYNYKIVSSLRKMDKDIEQDNFRSQREWIRGCG